MASTTYDPITSPTASNLICNTCGTQYPETTVSSRATCLICDDARQYVPPSGQSFTTLSSLSSSPENYRNVFTPYPQDPRLISINTQPKLAIGQRAILIRTESGKNILWDCLTFLDVATVARINNLGGLAGIVISHPHYYSTHAEWSRAFGDCPVYTAARDRSFKVVTRETDVLLDADKDEFDIIDGGVKILQLGGHFPGSLVALFDGRLLVADTLLTTPSGVGKWEVDAAGKRREDKPAGLNTFSFMWSVPNWIPLGPEEIAGMWAVLKRYDFKATHGAFVGQDIEDEEGIKGRVLESMKIQVRRMGWKEHALLAESL